MSVTAKRRFSMLLFSHPDCCWSHRLRLVLAEKAVTAEIIDVNDEQIPAELLALNPRGSVPTLVDRDLVLYDSRVAMEYLDERFPHPPLLPPDPISRARFRMALSRIEMDWLSLLPTQQQISDSDANTRKQLQDKLGEALASSIDLFAAKPYFLSDELSLLDCTLAPLLWRLPALEIELTSQMQVISHYAQRLFKRPAFRASLSTVERRMEILNSRLYDI